MSNHHHNDHGSGGCCHGESHDHKDEERGVLYSLYQKIHIDQVTCLNESTDGSGKLVFKPWEDRLNKWFLHRILIDM